MCVSVCLNPVSSSDPGLIDGPLHEPVFTAQSLRLCVSPIRNPSLWLCRCLWPSSCASPSLCAAPSPCPYPNLCSYSCRGLCIHLCSTSVPVRSYGMLGSYPSASRFLNRHLRYKRRLCIECCVPIGRPVPISRYVFIYQPTSTCVYVCIQLASRSQPARHDRRTDGRTNRRCQF